MKITTETCPSNRSRCYSCSEKIQEGTRRLVFLYKDGVRAVSIKWCTECAKRLLVQLMDELTTDQK